MKTMIAKITTDAKKLWSCNNFRLVTSTKHRGKLPLSSGEEITLELPGETPCSFCQAKRAWRVVKPPKSIKYPVGLMVCEHQVDLPNDAL